MECPEQRQKLCNRETDCFLPKYPYLGEGSGFFSSLWSDKEPDRAVEREDIGGGRRIKALMSNYGPATEKM